MILFDISDSVNRVASAFLQCYPACIARAGGLGREPQQAEKHTRAAPAAWVNFRVCGYTSIACTVTKTVYLQMKLDNHFTHLVFWILHELDMIEP